MTHPLLTRFEQLNGRHVTLPELKNFLARVQGELDNHSHGPAASALENVRKRLANAIQKATPYFANAQPGDQFKVVLSGRKPKAAPQAQKTSVEKLIRIPGIGKALANKIRRSKPVMEVNHTKPRKLKMIAGVGELNTAKTKAGKTRQRKAVFAKLEKSKKAWQKKNGVRVDPAVDNFYPTEDEAKNHASGNQTVRQAKDGMWEVINKPVAKPSPIKNLNGIVDAAHLAGINFSVIDLPEPYRTQLHKLHSDSQVMMWGIPGSGKTVYTLKFGQALAELGLPVLYVANEEYGRSTFSEKIRTFNIGHPNLKFAKTLDESVIDQFAVVFLDSINSLGMTLRDWIKFRDRHPGKLFVLIVQSTKDGDFRGGKDWEHEVDIAGEIINRQLVLRKNRLDPDNASKYEQRMTQAAIDDARKRAQIKQAVKTGQATPSATPPAAPANANPVMINV